MAAPPTTEPPSQREVEQTLQTMEHLLRGLNERATKRDGTTGRMNSVLFNAKPAWMEERARLRAAHEDPGLTHEAKQAVARDCDLHKITGGGVSLMAFNGELVAYTLGGNLSKVPMMGRDGMVLSGADGTHVRLTVHEGVLLVNGTPVGAPQGFQPSEEWATKYRKVPGQTRMWAYTAWCAMRRSAEKMHLNQSKRQADDKARAAAAAAAIAAASAEASASPPAASSAAADDDDDDDEGAALLKTAEGGMSVQGKPTTLQELLASAAKEADLGGFGGESM